MPRPFQRQAMTAKKNDYLYRRPAAQVPVWKKRWFLLLGVLGVVWVLASRWQPTPPPSEGDERPQTAAEQVTPSTSPSAEFDFYTQLTAPENSMEQAESKSAPLYILHVAKFKQTADAQVVLKKIQDIHITPYMIRTESGYDVLIGPFSSEIGAQKTWQQLQSLALPYTISIQRYPNPA